MVAEGGAIAAGVEIIAEARLAESGTPVNLGFLRFCGTESLASVTFGTCELRFICARPVGLLHHH